VRLQIGTQVPRTLRSVQRPRSCVLAQVAAVSILLSPATGVADESATQAVRSQNFEEAISASIRASTARELAAARAQAERELRGLPAKFQWHGWAETDVLALCGAVELEFHPLLGP
jgi:hypothetical protein